METIEEARPEEETPGSGEATATGEHRAAPRESLFLSAEVRRGGVPVTGRIRNVSATGAYLEVTPTPAQGEHLVLSFRGVDAMEAVVVRQAGKGVGVHFAEPIDPSACRMQVGKRETDWTKDYVLSLREGYRPLRWQTDGKSHRPRLS